ncbi:hypothetical protein [Neptuniibacter sp. QD37_11]|uniref:hypothetical protein n=1 Tax=Neptuniibacter sp. QD37_11 TaxID=3398209 RepID=UPI0039F54C58
MNRVNSVFNFINRNLLGKSAATCSSMLNKSRLEELGRIKTFWHTACDEKLTKIADMKNYLSANAVLAKAGWRTVDGHDSQVHLIHTNPVDGTVITAEVTLVGDAFIVSAHGHKGADQEHVLLQQHLIVAVISLAGHDVDESRAA